MAAVFVLAGCDDSPTDPPPPVPTSVAVTPTSVTLTEVGQTAELSAVVLDADGVEIEGAAVTWSSSDANVATVNQAGVVEAVAEGTATITAQSGDASGTAQVTVEIAAPVPTEVVVTPDAVTLEEVGATAELSAVVLDADGVEIEGAAVVWSTSDAEVATVDEDGVVEAVGEGTATITAQSGDASGTAEVTVDLAPAPAAVVVTPEEVLLTEIGATFELSAQVLDADGVEIEEAVVVWSTSDAEVATVSEDGEVEAVAEGTATITAESGDVSGEAEVTVDLGATAPAAIVVTPEAVLLAEVGATAELTAVVLDADALEIDGAAVVWSTSNAAVATVSEDGVVEAVGDGTATITARFFQVSGTVEVTVELPAPVPAEVVVTPGEVLLTEIGATFELTAQVLDANDIEIEGAAVVWSTSDADVATVSEDGVVEATGEGTATITAESGDASGTAEVTVDLGATAPAEVVVTPAEVTLAAIGATAELTAEVRDADGEEIAGVEVVWSSSNTAVATVSEDGEVEAVAEGTAVITARYFHVSGTAEVTVEVDG